MRQKIRQAITQFHMLSKGMRIIVGVSGGADSVALLTLLHELAAEWELKLFAVHINHGLRGEEAMRDQAFVERFCEKLSIPCKVYCFSVREEAKKRRLGEEETGRLLRYEAFRKEAQGGKIAVAHHANDQAETILMRLSRGTGLTGLCGMQPVAGDILRPLLYCTRREIEEFCEAEGLTYCEDSTNAQTDYTRNHIRHDILPMLSEVNPKAVEHISQMAALLAEDESFFAAEAEQTYQRLHIQMQSGVAFQREELMKLHPALRKRVLRKALAQIGGIRDLSFTHSKLLEELLFMPTGKTLSLPRGICAKNSYDRLLLLQEEPSEPKSFCYPLLEGEPIFIHEAGIEITLSRDIQKNTEILSDGCTNVFDYDKIEQDIFCRTRQSGDRIALRGGSRKLKDYLIDEKIPRDERARIPLIACKEDVLWVVGGQASVRYQADENTKCFLSIRIRRIQ